MNVPVVRLENVHAEYGSNEILKGISLTVEQNQRWAIIGRNGAGKSTLVKIVADLLHPGKGALDINGIPAQQYTAKKRAKIMAYVPQKPDGVIPYSVHDFVMLGRYCAMGFLGMPSQEDSVAVCEAINICDIGHLAGRRMNTLSGGELQRVLLAGAVAQQTPLLLLDEPTASLDPAHERLFFEAIARLNERRKLTIIMITHDINTALVQCSHVGALLNGQFIFTGTTMEFKTKCPAILKEIFDVDFERYISPDGKSEAFGAWSASCPQ
ncbi:MAG TPA: cobalamin/Fe(3+)-siderophore ABC transporter ATP-binding protein [Fibrobacteres bacterium]|nr:cobalamin/Fe(3+)-siderophore ABC transporter ATP-binding protein [Fibrobacterota bacterium]